MSETWQTKYGLRRVRRDPPTVAEAIAAAQGLTDDREQQVQIASELMGTPTADVRAEMKKIAPDRRVTMTLVAQARDKGSRTVVVERKTSRRPASAVQRSVGAGARPR